MMTGSRVIWLAAVASIALGACGQSGASSSGGATSTFDHSVATQTSVSATGSAGSVTNADGTVTDSDGFVRFPGEPTRPDQDHYYVVEDICGQFTQGFMEGLTGRTFKRINALSSSTVYACDYYISTVATDGNDSYLALVLTYLNVAHQKAAQQSMGLTVATNSSIPMDNWVATRDNGIIDAVYFVLGPDKFLRLDRSPTSALSGPDMLALGVKLGTKMKDFK